MSTGLDLGHKASILGHLLARPPYRLQRSAAHSGGRRGFSLFIFFSPSPYLTFAIDLGFEKERLSRGLPRDHALRTQPAGDPSRNCPGLANCTRTQGSRTSPTYPRHLHCPFQVDRAGTTSGTQRVGSTSTSKPTSDGQSETYSDLVE